MLPNVDALITATVTNNRVNDIPYQKINPILPKVAFTSTTSRDA